MGKVKSGLIVPVSNIDKDLNSSKEHLFEEFAEVSEAWKDWDEEDAKTTAHLMEEIIDLATACMTLASRLETATNTHELVNNTLLFVATKNYIRGYHDEPMI